MGRVTATGEKTRLGPLWRRVMKSEHNQTLFDSLSKEIKMPSVGKREGAGRQAGGVYLSKNRPK